MFTRVALISSLLLAVLAEAACHPGQPIAPLPNVAVTEPARPTSVTLTGVTPLPTAPPYPGGDKIDQCNRLVRVINEAGAEFYVPSTTQGRKKMADAVDKMVEVITTTEVSIPELQNFRDRYTTYYRDFAEALRNVAMNMDEVVKRDSKLTFEVNTFCQSNWRLKARDRTYQIRPLLAWHHEEQEDETEQAYGFRNAHRDNHKGQAFAFPVRNRATRRCADQTLHPGAKHFRQATGEPDAEERTRIGGEDRRIVDRTL